MATEETRSLLEYLRYLHHKLATHYHRLARTQSSERLKLLLDYLSEHEERLSRALAEYGEGADEGVLNAWQRWLDEPDPASLIAEINLPPDASEDDVVEEAMRVSRELIERYRTQSEAAPDNRVGNALRSLISMEEKSLAQVARDTGRMRDL